jgi:hypothetical protein
VADLPTTSAKNDTGEYDRFNSLMRRVLSVSKTELQRRLEEERTSRDASSSRDSGD